MRVPISLNKYFFIMLLASTLSGCGIKPLEIFNTAIEKPALNIEMPETVYPSPVVWFVITPENTNLIFNRLQKSKKASVLFGLTDDGYQNLSANYAQMLKYIIEQKTIIQQYKKYYEFNINKTKLEK